MPQTKKDKVKESIRLKESLKDPGAEQAQVVPSGNPLHSVSNELSSVPEEQTHHRWNMRWTAISSISTAVAAILACVAAHFAAVTYDSTVDTSKKTLRAYVGLQEIALKIPSTIKTNYKPLPITAGSVETDFVVLNIKNYGSTPAKDVTVTSSWKTQPFPYQLPQNFEYPDLKGHLPPSLDLIKSKVVIHPGQEWKSKIAVHDVSPFIDASKQKVMLFLYGHVDYSDIYDQKHRTDFCYVYEPGTQGEDPFVPYSVHNQAD